VSALEKGEADFFFQVPYGQGKTLLGNEPPFRGPGKILLLADGKEIKQLPVFHCIIIQQ
jgi:hypothetical protein